jgi:hypothetical protein
MNLEPEVAVDPEQTEEPSTKEPLPEAGGTESKGEDETERGEKAGKTAVAEEANNPERKGEGEAAALAEEAAELDGEGEEEAREAERAGEKEKRTQGERMGTKSLE